ncbi:hypothetical protein ABPG75_013303 [Micractinium tetrahymenae]
MWQPLGAGGGGAYGQQFDRAQQVNELLVAQPLCRAINPDRTLLEVGVRLQDGTLTSLRISLPPGFPSERPALSITSPVRHPWVDSIGRLSFPLLDRWAAPSIRLATVVADAFKGLGGQPALAPSKAGAAAQQQAAAAQQQAQQPGRPGAQQHVAAAAAAQHPPPGPQSSLGRLSAAGSGPASLAPGSGPPSLMPAGSAPGREQPPAIPTTFPEVAAMSNEELSRALSEPGAYQRLVQAAAQRLDLWQGVERLKGETRELAAANLARSEEQAGIRNQMAVVRASDYAPAKAAFDDKWARQQAVLAKLSPEVLMRRLQEATREAEEQGEQLLAQLGAGEVGLEAFVERYTRAQATYHQRDLKLQAAQQTLPPLHPR